MNAPFLRVALSGIGAGAGKDTLANALNARHDTVSRSLAGPFKAASAELLGVPLSELERIKSDKSHPKNTAVRRLWQAMGTLYRDAWDVDVWPNALLRDAERIEAEGLAAGVVVTDVRFTNEFDALERAGYLMVDVHAPARYLRLAPPSPWRLRAYHALPRVLRDALGRRNPRYHSSERDLDAYRAEGRFHLTVMNDRETSVNALVADIVGHALAKAWQHVPAAIVPEPAESDAAEERALAMKWIGPSTASDEEREARERQERSEAAERRARRFEREGR